MPGHMPPIDLSRQVADLMKRIQRLERTTASGGFDPNADPVVIGPNTNGNGQAGGVVLGAYSSITNTFGISIGGGISAGDYAVQVGFSGQARADGAVALGPTAVVVAGATAAVAIGQLTTAWFAHSTALGPGAATTKVNQVMLGTSDDFVEIPGDSSTAPNGLVLTDTATGTRYLVQITSGALVLSAAP